MYEDRKVDDHSHQYLGAEFGRSGARLQDLGGEELNRSHQRYEDDDQFHKINAEGGNN